MAKKAKKAAKKKKKVRRTKPKKGIIGRFVEAISPTRRNSPGGNITRRQGV